MTTDDPFIKVSGYWRQPRRNGGWQRWGICPTCGGPDIPGHSHSANPEQGREEAEMAAMGSASINLRVSLGEWDTKNRPSWDHLFLAMADLMSFRGTCPARRVGAVITLDNYIIAEGYNGAPRGLVHCVEAGCSPDAHGRCTRAVHAELNALLQAARMGFRVGGGTLYCTDRPCLNCAKAIVQAGISCVVYWKDDLESSQREGALHTLRSSGLTLREEVPFSYIHTHKLAVQ